MTIPRITVRGVMYFTDFISAPVRLFEKRPAAQQRVHMPREGEHDRVRTRQAGPRKIIQSIISCPTPVVNTTGATKILSRQNENVLDYQSRNVLL